ncbi:ankyrin repeat domain-containing protein [Ferrimonas kyonanensis]|uniref:ankyrin repeat domain-containing protein n=1 Tax=Ferrimonas kyonanensis TaxID=364763 RepID=UPI00040A126A|nr:ankyrin repeat domain-containing protein [Ferrimonas kyonanensis]
MNPFVVPLVTLLIGFVLGSQWHSLEERFDSPPPEPGIEFEYDLVEAIALNDLQQAQHALDSGQLASVSDSDSTTALELALINGNAEMVTLLLGHDADPNRITSSGMVPLALALLAEDIPSTQALLDAGADPHAMVTLGEDRFSLTELAQSSGNPGLLTLFDPNAADALQARLTQLEASQALMGAAAGGELDRLQQLIDDNADPNAIDREGWSPLHHAAASDQGQAVTVLLRAGSRPNSQTPTGFTPLMFAASQNAIEAAKALLSANPQLDQSLTNQQGLTAYDLASLAGHQQLAAHLEPTGHRDNNPSLMDAIFSDDIGQFMATLKVSEQQLLDDDDQGWTPLMHAAYRGNTEMVDVILKRSPSSIYATAPDGASALALAVINGHGLTADTLIRARAPLEIRVKGVGLPQLAQQRGHSALANTLTEQLQYQTKQLQRELLYAQYPAGKPDGVFGNQTRLALSQLAKDHPSTDGMSHQLLTNFLYQKNRDGVFVCNISSKAALWTAIAITHRRTQQSSSRGWYKTEKNRCRRFDIKSDYDVYVWTQSGNIKWQSNNKQNPFCIDMVDPFQFSYPRSCDGKNLKHQYFRKKEFGNSTRITIRYVD